MTHTQIVLMRIELIEAQLLASPRLWGNERALIKELARTLRDELRPPAFPQRRFG